MQSITIFGFILNLVGLLVLVRYRAGPGGTQRGTALRDRMFLVGMLIVAVGTLCEASGSYAPASRKLEMAGQVAGG